MAGRRRDAVGVTVVAALVVALMFGVFWRFRHDRRPPSGDDMSEPYPLSRQDEPLRLRVDQVGKPSVAHRPPPAEPDGVSPPLASPDDTAVSELACLALYQRRESLLALARAVEAAPPEETPVRVLLSLAEAARDYELARARSACAEDSSPVPYILEVVTSPLDASEEVEAVRAIEILDGLAPE